MLIHLIFLIDQSYLLITHRVNIIITTHIENNLLPVEHPRIAY